MTRLKKTIALTLVLSSLFAVAVAAQLDTLIKGLLR